MDIVMNDHLGDQMNVFDNLALLMPDAFRYDAFPTKKKPIHEVVEFFAFDRRCIDGFSEISIIDVFQQELCTYDSAQFAKVVVQLVFATGCSKSSQNG